MQTPSIHFRVQPISAAIVAEVRQTLRSPQYGHPAHVSTAGPNGYGPCRACLRTFRPGEQRILFTYEPFAGTDADPLPGPVFIHQEPCGSELDSEVHLGEFPAELRPLPLLFEAYGAHRRQLERHRLGSESAEAVITRLLADENVRYLHIRNFEAGCFIAAIERATKQNPT